MKSVSIAAPWATLLLLSCQARMSHQPRYNPYSASDFFADGTSAQSPPEHTVAREMGSKLPALSGQKLLERGRSRYNAYCIACHSALGDGDGIVVHRGFSAPPSFHQARLRQAPDSHFDEVIRSGFGRMYRLGDRIGDSDRRAIIAYVRALQLSQNAAAAELPASLKRKLNEKSRSSP